MLRKAIKESDTSLQIVIFMGFVLLVYAAIILVFSWYDKMVPDSLTVAMFAAFGFESGALAHIKVHKNKDGTETITTDFETDDVETQTAGEPTSEEPVPDRDDEDESGE